MQANETDDYQIRHTSKSVENTNIRRRIGRIWFLLAPKFLSWLRKRAFGGSLANSRCEMPEL